VRPFHSLATPILDTFHALTEADLDFGPSPKLDVGDVALRTFVAAKKLNMPPPNLAAAIAADVDFGDVVIEARPAGPYLNFRLNRSAFARVTLSFAVCCTTSGKSRWTLRCPKGSRGWWSAFNASAPASVTLSGICSAWITPLPENAC